MQNFLAFQNAQSPSLVNTFMKINHMMMYKQIVLLIWTMLTFSPAIKVEDDSKNMTAKLRSRAGKFRNLSINN